MKFPKNIVISKCLRPVRGMQVYLLQSKLMTKIVFHFWHQKWLLFFSYHFNNAIDRQDWIEYRIHSHGTLESQLMILLMLPLSSQTTFGSIVFAVHQIEEILLGF